jgi:hypothetical protein
LGANASFAQLDRGPIQCLDGLDRISAPALPSPSMPSPRDTIVALSWGCGGTAVAVIRISGPRAGEALHSRHSYWPSGVINSIPRKYAR